MGSGSGIRKKLIQHPGVKKAPEPGSRIRIQNTLIPGTVVLAWTGIWLKGWDRTQSPGKTGNAVPYRLSWHRLSNCHLTFLWAARDFLPFQVGGRCYDFINCCPTTVLYSTMLELANVKQNCKYLISSIWPRLKQELVEKYIKLGPVLFHII